jgi:hypothetical protein
LLVVHASSLRLINNGGEIAKLAASNTTKGPHGIEHGHEEIGSRLFFYSRSSGGFCGIAVNNAGATKAEAAKLGWPWHAGKRDQNRSCSFLVAPSSGATAIVLAGRTPIRSQSHR